MKMNNYTIDIRITNVIKFKINFEYNARSGDVIFHDNTKWHIGKNKSIEEIKIAVINQLKIISSISEDYEINYL